MALILQSSLLNKFLDPAHLPLYLTSRFSQIESLIKTVPPSQLQGLKKLVLGTFDDVESQNLDRMTHERKNCFINKIGEFKVGFQTLILVF